MVKKKIYQPKEVSHRQMTKKKILVLIQNALLMLLMYTTPRLTDGLFSLFQIAAEAAEVILLKALILQVLCLYQKVVPHLVSQCKFDFSKLFKGLFFFFFLGGVYLQFME